MRQRPLAVGAFLVVLFAAASSRAVDVAAWHLLADSPPFPPTIRVPLGVYDPLRHRMLAIDADWFSHTLAVHVFDPVPSPHWSTVPVVGDAPTEQYLPAMVYDPLRDRLLVLSGWPPPFGVWDLPLSGTATWQEIVTSGGSPGPRTGQSAIYDPVHDRVVLCGGADGGYPANYLSDVWELSLATNTWKLLAPASGVPPGREGHGALYDPVKQRMLMFGGHYEANARGFWNDLWELSLGDSPAWTELHPAGTPPGARSAFATVYDPVRRQMLVHGGVNDQSGIEPDELWALSLDGTPVWTQIETTNRLLGRSYPLDFYDPFADRLLACGGGSYPQTSELPLQSPTAWRPVLPRDPPDSPSPRWGNAVVRDAKRDRFVVVGGTFSQADSSVWGFDQGASNPWQPLGSSLTPDIQIFDEHTQVAACDSARDLLIARDWGQAWSMPAAGGNNWTAMAQGPPFVELSPDNVGFDAGMSIDGKRHRLIITGGFETAGHAAFGTTRGVWSLPLETGGAWSLLGHLPQDYGSGLHASFADPIRDRLILVGGQWEGGRFQVRRAYGPTVWVTPLDSSLSWTDLSSTTGMLPPGPPDSRAAFDPRSNRLFLFADSSVWVRNVDDTGPWQRLEFASPRPAVSTPVAWDPLRDQAVALFAHGPGSDDVQAWAFTYGPPSAALEESIVSSRAIALKWLCPVAIGRFARVERREGESPWREVGALTFDDFGMATFADPFVALGHRYDYRLVVFEPKELGWVSNASTIAMPPDGRLTMLGSSRNPAVGSIRITFNLPETGPARIEAFDVNGRRCASHDVGGLGPGMHSIALDEGAALKPGVYWIRLQMGNDARTARVVLVR